MLTLSRDFRELLELLNSTGVKYLVLCGYAVNYGHHRNKKDLDIWIAVEADNAERVSAALQRFGFPASSVPADQFLLKGKVFVLGREPHCVDLLTSPSGVTFDECYARRVDVVLDGVSVPLIHLDDLRSNKRASGRAKDLLDVESLLPAVP